MLKIVDDIIHNLDTFRLHSLVSTRNKWLFMGVPKCACTNSKLLLHQGEGLVTAGEHDIHWRDNPSV